MSIDGSSSSADSSSSDFGLTASSRIDRENKAAREARRGEIDELRNRLNIRASAQERLMSKYRSSEDTPVGGVLGKFMHLGDLNAETLTGQVIALLFFNLLGFAMQREHGLDLAIHGEAENTNVTYGEGDSGTLAYDGSQTIYRRGPDGEVNFNDPYRAGEEVLLGDIYNNGYIPPADLFASLAKQFGAGIQDTIGAKGMGEDLAVQMFGANKGRELYKKHGPRSGKDDASDMAAMPKPPKLP
tara:strand:- start:6559 stop:7287 length:729 start_codon:yes stop_codon:yes gene_type:complete